MKFYGRTQEIDILRKIQNNSNESAQFTVVTGRRRIGKTELIREAFGDSPEAFGDSPYLYYRIRLPIAIRKKFCDNTCIQPQGSAKAERGLGSQDPRPYLYEDKCIH